jgi:hypothetical protein
MDQIRERFGQPVQSKLELFGANGVALDGQDPNLLKGDENGQLRMTFEFRVRNVGNGLTGPIWLKLYTRKDLPTFDPTDEPNYAFEAWIAEKNIQPNNLPGGFALTYPFQFLLPTPSQGRHPVLSLLHSCFTATRNCFHSLSRRSNS